MIECFLKDGLPQIDLCSPQCEPHDEGSRPRWLRTVPPQGGKGGKAILQGTLGKRVPHPEGQGFGCISPSDLGRLATDSGWDTLVDAAHGVELRQDTVSEPRECLSVQVAECSGGAPAQFSAEDVTCAADESHSQLECR